MKFITSGGLAPMGYSMPAAIGLNFADATHKIYCICGDGGFHMSSQSLGVIAQYHLPIKIMVMNNTSLGMITQFQHLYFENRMVGTTRDGGYVVPNLEYMAKAYGLRYARILSDDLQDNSRFKGIVENSDVVEYFIEGLTTVCPKLEYNQPIENPLPFLPESEREKILFKS